MGGIMERLSKILAQAGVASRRKAEELITSGRVTVNGEKITVLGSKAAQKDIILVDGKAINKEELVYYILNKPTGYLSTTSDVHKRRNILDLFDSEARLNRLFPVHKLEYDSAGVLLVTNDGVLTKRLTESNAGIEKEYLIRVDGIVIKEIIRQARLGVKFLGKEIKPIELSIVELDKKNKSTLLRMVITDETNKDIRLMFENLGHKVKNLTRTRFDLLTLENVARGGYRRLKAHEIKRLYREND